MTIDSFKVPTLNKDWNLYNKYASNNNRFSTGVHQYVHKTSFGKYAFTGIDLAPVPGPGRPFNFFALPSPVSSLYIISLLFLFNLRFFAFSVIKKKSILWKSLKFLIHI